MVLPHSLIKKTWAMPPKELKPTSRRMKEQGRHV